MAKKSGVFVFALGAVFFWSTVATAFKLTLRYVNPFTMLFFAALVSLSVQFLIIKIAKKKIVWNKKALLLGFLNPLLYYILLFEAYNRLLAQQALCINYLWPVALVLISVVIRGERLKFRGLFGIVLGLIGVVFVATRGHFRTLLSRNWLGVLYALLSVFVWAAYWDINRFIKLDAEVKLFQGFLFALLPLFVIFLLFGNQSHYLKGFYGSVYIGIFEMGLTFFFWMRALEGTDNVQKIASLIYIAPPVSLIIIHFILKEKLYAGTFIGLLLILSGVYLSKEA